MKHRITSLLLGAVILTASSCTEDSDVFHTTTRHITRVEAKVVIADPKPEPEPEPAPQAAETAPDAESPLVAQIREELMAKSPAREGDTYVFHFMVYNAGRLDLQSGDTMTEGRFTKVPGSDEIGFLFDGEYHIAKVSSDKEQTANGEIYTFDFTEEYQRRYPDARLMEVKRLEYIEQ